VCRSRSCEGGGFEMGRWFWWGCLRWSVGKGFLYVMLLSGKLWDGNKLHIEGLNGDRSMK